jgi:hypothetical protein
MKRAYDPVTRRYVGTSGNIKEDLGQKKLAAIGAVAMAYNKVEEEIEALFGIATKLEGQILLEVSTRINGIDGKIAIIKSSVDTFGVEDEDKRQIAEALGDGVFTRLKGYRDSVVHARLINAAIGVGIRYEKRAKINEVLLSESALNALYEHLLALAQELQCAASILLFALEINTRAAGDPERASYAAGKSENSAQFRRYQNRRQSLQPIPGFPSEQEFREADVEWRQARQSAMMGRILIVRPQEVFFHPQSWTFPGVPPTDEK